MKWIYFILDIVIICLIGIILGALIYNLKVSPNEMLSFLRVIQVPLHNILMGIFFVLLFILPVFVLDAIGTIIKEIRDERDNEQENFHEPKQIRT